MTFSTILAAFRSVLVAVLLTLSTLTPPAPVRRVLVGVAAIAVLGVLAVHHYGDSTALNQGYEFDSRSVTVGYETVGEPGLFGQVATVFGVETFGPWGAVWCPAGRSDIECGA